jgi:hypothetical protein
MNEVKVEGKAKVEAEVEILTIHAEKQPSSFCLKPYMHAMFLCS